MIDEILAFYNRCECGISRYGFCHYCGGDWLITTLGIVFVLLLLYKQVKYG